MNEPQDIRPHIRTHGALLEAARHVAKTYPDLGRALAQAEAEIGPLPDRSRPPGFEALLNLIVGQQVSLASARAIWARIEDKVQPLTAQTLLALPPETFDTLGLSRPKKIYARHLAEAFETGSFCEKTVSTLAFDEAYEALIALKGIGPWTAQTYLLFCHGARDAWPGGDVALQVAAQDLLGLETRPDTAQMEEIGERWRPWRGVAAHILWAYYKTLS